MVQGWGEVFHPENQTMAGPCYLVSDTCRRGGGPDGELQRPRVAWDKAGGAGRQQRQLRDFTPVPRSQQLGALWVHRLQNTTHIHAGQWLMNDLEIGFPSPSTPSSGMVRKKLTSVSCNVMYGRGAPGMAAFLNIYSRQKVQPTILQLGRLMSGGRGKNFEHLDRLLLGVAVDLFGFVEALELVQQHVRRRVVPATARFPTSTLSALGGENLHTLAEKSCSMPLTVF